MPDNPHDPELRTEASFMLAAEHAIKTLQDQEESLREDLKSANDKLEAASRAATRRTWWNTALSLVAVLLIVVSALTARGYYDQRDLYHRLQQGSVASCRAGNVFRAEQTTIWSEFLTLALAPNAGVQRAKAELESRIRVTFPPAEARVLTDYIETVQPSHPSKSTQAVAHQFAEFISMVDTPRNCTQVYRAIARS